MPNITLSVSNEMKERMDTFSEVSWSDVCRNAIQSYLEEREKDTRVSDTKNLKVISYIEPLVRRKDNKLVYLLKIKNNEAFDIIIDRVLFSVFYENEENNIKLNDSPLNFFNMVNIPSNQFQLISSIDGLDDAFKHNLFEIYDKEAEIKWTIYGDIFYRSKTEIYRTGFRVVGILDDDSKGFIHDQMAI